MQKLLMLAGGLSLCLMLPACKTSRRAAKPPFSCEEIEAFVEKNWQFQSEENWYKANQAFMLSLEENKLENCLTHKDTAWVTKHLGVPNEYRGAERNYQVIEMAYYLSYDCHPPGKVCKQLIVRFWPKTGKVAVVEIREWFSYH